MIAHSCVSAPTISVLNFVSCSVGGICVENIISSFMKGHLLLIHPKIFGTGDFNLYEAVGIR